MPILNLIRHADRRESVRKEKMQPILRHLKFTVVAAGISGLVAITILFFMQFKLEQLLAKPMLALATYAICAFLPISFICYGLLIKYPENNSD